MTLLSIYIHIYTFEKLFVRGILLYHVLINLYSSIRLD